MRKQKADEPFWRRSNPVAWGIGCSAVLVGIVLWMTFYRGGNGIPGYREFIVLSPNEMGDTLAGIFTSLAFIWIVVSTFIQRSELYSTVLELRETTRLARERSSLREYEFLVSKIEEAFCSMNRDEAMYGEWAFRIKGQDHLEHAYLRGRKPTDIRDIKGSIGRLGPAVEKTHGLLHSPSAAAEQRPKRRQEHAQMLSTLNHLLEIAPDLPRMEARYVNDWKLERSAKLLGEIWDNDNFWKLEKPE